MVYMIGIVIGLFIGAAVLAPIEHRERERSKR